MRRVLLEVYTSEKPARPRRGVLCAAALLVATVILAATMTWRGADGGLPSRIHPPGWRVSFEPPRHFQPDHSLPAPLGPAIRFLGRTGRGRPMILMLHEVVGDTAMSSLDLCALVLRGHSEGRRFGVSFTGLSGITAAKPLGPLDGAEFREADGALVVRAAMLDEHTGYAISLTVLEGELDEIAYQTFTRVCESVEVEAP